MSSNNYGVVTTTMDMNAVVSGDDRMKPYYIYSTDNPAGDIPDLLEMEASETITGNTVRDLISIAEKLHIIDWGNGFHGLCINDGTHMHFIVRKST